MSPSYNARCGLLGMTGVRPWENLPMDSPGREYYERRYRERSDRWTRDPEEEVTRVLVQELGQRSRQQPLKILDVGCGRLKTAFKLRASVNNIQITAIDFAYDGIVASDPDLPARASTIGIEFLKADLFEFVAPEPFDVVFDSGLLHHLVPEDWSRYVTAVDRLVAHNRVLLIHSFHPRDGNWPREQTGGHERKGYYCHYHTLESLAELLQDVFDQGRQLAIMQHYEHVTGWYAFER